MRVARVLIALGFASLMAVLVTGPAFADGACQSEIDRFCQGEKAILKCLRKNQTSLSPSCSTYVGLFEQIPSCLRDARALCPTDHPTVTTVVGCLRGHSDEISAECRAELAKIRKDE